MIRIPPVSVICRDRAPVLFNSFASRCRSQAFGKYSKLQQEKHISVELLAAHKSEVGVKFLYAGWYPFAW